MAHIHSVQITTSGVEITKKSETAKTCLLHVDKGYFYLKIKRIVPHILLNT